MAEPDFIPASAPPDFIPVSKSAMGATAAPKDRFTQDREITEAWAQKHPVLGPIARFTVSAGQNAANAITETPGQIYHAIADPSGLDEAGLDPKQRLIYRLGGKQAIEAGEDYASGKVKPKGALSVLPEALGTGVGQVAGGATYGKVGEVAPDIVRGTVSPVVRATARGINQVLEHPEVAGATAGSAAGGVLGHHTGLPGGGTIGAGAGAGVGATIGRIAGKKIGNFRVPGENFGLPKPVYPGAPLPEAPIANLSQARALERPGAAPAEEPSAGLGRIARPQAEILHERLGEPAPTSPLDRLRNQPLPKEQPEFTPKRPSLDRIAPEEGGGVKEVAPAAVAPISAAKPSAPPQLDQLLNEGLGGRELQPNVPLRQQLSRIGKPSAPIKTAPLGNLASEIEKSAPPSQAPKMAPLTDLGADIRRSAIELPEGFTPVESRALRGYKYNPEAREFEAVTNTGQHYVHTDVSPEQAATFEAADSKGNAWNELKKAPGVTLTKKGPVGRVSPVRPGELKTAKGAIAKSEAGMNPDADLTPLLKQSVRAAKARKIAKP